MVITQNPLLMAFENVARLGTVHAAAAALNLTQTAATKRIHTLENDLAVSLFLRSRRGMSLTSEGKALLQLCKAGLELEGHFLTQIKGQGRNEISLKIVGPTSAISTRIAENCEHLYEKYSFLQLHLQSDDHSDLIEKIRRGEADLAIVDPKLVPNEMDSKVLKPDCYFLVASASWKGRRLQDILENERMIDFYESDQTTQKYLKKFALHVPLKTRRIFVNENEALIRFFKKGIGFGTLTESVAKPYLDSGELITLNKNQTLEDALALVWYPRPQKSDFFTDLVRSIK